MKIYVEQVLLTNFIIDFCILVVISKVVCSKPSYKRIILSALFGSIATLILPYCTNLILTNALKILTAIIMLQILHIHKKQLVTSSLLMLVLSYIIGGAILSNFGSSTANGYGISKINLMYVLIIAIAFTFITCKLISWLKSKIATNSNIFDITLIYNNNQITIKSFIDSGNGLYDNGSPVSL
ncbi:MAG: sigma-E processing peptidase SpoIIGA, partial [Clostridia bacterium]|nr:sigma-E processing peptidase SpoIIGA [Clostridia bacterium]